jgi:hypothetical protein
MKKEEVERIFDRAKHELLALLLSESRQSNVGEQQLPEWLTEEQLMKYWQLDSTSGIRSWRKRSSDQFPLPHGRCGDLVRYNRKACDQWLGDEATRKKLAKPKGAK